MVFRLTKKKSGIILWHITIAWRQGLLFDFELFIDSYGLFGFGHPISDVVFALLL